jgi:hypothetical protein
MTPNTGRATIYVNPAEPTIVVSTPQYEAVGALAEGLDLDIRRNKFQGAVVGASAVVGAIIG